MKIRILIFWFIIFCSRSSYSQDPLFVNSQQSLVYLNPSFAGSNGLFRTQSMYRVPSGPDIAYSSTTLYNGADVYIKALNGGIAVTHLHDDYRRGTLKTDIVALSYAQYFSLLNNHLKIIPSIQMAYLQKELDLRKISFGELEDGRLAAQWPVIYG